MYSVNIVYILYRICNIFNTEFKKKKDANKDSWLPTYVLIVI